MRSVLAAGFLDPEALLRQGGLALLGLIVFAESGLLIGFFLPGDSLLFIAGFLASDAGGNVLPPLPVVLVVAFVTAVLGDQVGYVFGKKVGPALFDKPDSRIFKQKYVEKAHTFFERHGAKTIVLARFVPIVRTFAPIVAGVGEMRYRTFVTFNVVGGFLWAVGITTLGYFLGEIEVVKQNIEIAIVVIVALSVLPMAIEVLRHWRAARRRIEPATAVDLPPVPADVPLDARAVEVPAVD
jgi:membrane-associated protein